MNEALRLAGSLEHHTEQVKASNGRLTFVLMTPEETTAVAAELRRLDAENAALLAANRDCLLHFNTLKAEYDKAMKPLTDAEIDAIGAEQWMQPINAAEHAFARAIEAAHGITGEQT